jgi:hypothetical protein
VFVEATLNTIYNEAWLYLLEYKCGAWLASRRIIKEFVEKGVEEFAVITTRSRLYIIAILVSVLDGEGEVLREHSGVVSGLEFGVKLAQSLQRPCKFPRRIPP